MNNEENRIKSSLMERVAMIAVTIVVLVSCVFLGYAGCSRSAQTLTFENCLENLNGDKKVTAAEIIRAISASTSDSFQGQYVLSVDRTMTDSSIQKETELTDLDGNVLLCADLVCGTRNGEPTGYFLNASYFEDGNRTVITGKADTKEQRLNVNSVYENRVEESIRDETIQPILDVLSRTGWEIMNEFPQFFSLTADETADTVHFRIQVTDKDQLITALSKSRFGKLGNLWGDGYQLELTTGKDGVLQEAASTSDSMDELIRVSALNEDQKAVIKSLFSFHRSVGEALSLNAADFVQSSRLVD